MKRLALMLAAASLAAPVSAQSVSEEPRTISISTAGTRFDDAESVVRLRARIARAVRHVCATDGTSVGDYLHSRRCQAEAMIGSERQLTQLLERTRLAALSK